MTNKSMSNLNKTIRVWDLKETTTVSNSDVLLIDTEVKTLKTTKENLLKEVNEQLNTKSNSDHTHSEYVTESELNSKGLATEMFVTNKIAEAQLGNDGGNMDLSGYATTEYVDQEVGKTNAQLSHMAKKGFVLDQIALAKLEGAGVDTSTFTVQSQLDLTNENIFNRIYDVEWEIGSIGSNGVKMSSSTRVRTINFIHVKKGSVIQLTDYNQYKMCIFEYNIPENTESALKYAGNWITKKYVVADDCYLKIVIAYQNDTELSDNSISQNCIHTLLGSEIYTKKSEIEQLKVEMNEVLYEEVDGIQWEIGSISADGFLMSSDTRLRTSDFISMKKGTKISVKDYNLYKFIVYKYRRPNSEDMSLNSGWLSSEFILDEDCYIKILIAYKDNLKLTDTSISSICNIKCYRPIGYDYELFNLISYNDNIKSVAHRGYSIEAPENTLSAYKLAKKKGFKYVECDVSITSDGQFVLLHDSSINRTARNKDGSVISETINISEITLKEAREYDFGVFMSDKYKGEKIPTFEEFIKLCRELGLHPYIELKNNASYTQEQINELASIVKKYGMQARVSWISLKNTYCAYAKNADPISRIGFLANNISEWSITETLKYKTDTNSVFHGTDYRYVTNEMVDKCIEQGLAIEVYTVNDFETAKNLNPYISGVVSDVINVGIEYYKLYNQ